MITENINFEKETAFFQKVDRIITGNTKIKVNAKNTYSGLACTNLRTKEINLELKQMFDEVNQDKLRFIAISKGLNYHELAHIMHTRMNRKQTGSLSQREFEIMNTLEDGRIETIFSQKYSRTQKYFLNCFHQLIHKNAKENGHSPLTFLQSHSRHLFLDKKSLGIYEAMFNETFGDETTTTIKKLIDDYLKSRSVAEQTSIVKKIYAKLLEKNSNIPEMRIPQLSGSESLSSAKEDYDNNDEQDIKIIEITIEETKKGSKNKPSELPESIKKLIKEIKEQMKQQKKLDELQRKTQKKYDEEITKRYNKLKELSETDSKIVSANVDEKKKLNEKSKQIRDELQKTDLKRKKINDKCEELKNKNGELDIRKRIINKTIAREIEKLTKNDNQELEDANAEAEQETDQDLRTIYQDESTGMNAGSGLTPEIMNPSPFIPETHHRIIAKKLGDTLKKIQNDKRKGYIEHQKVGKINIGRAMNFPKTADCAIFNKYEPDKTRQTRIGVIILIDRSRSMRGHPYDQAFETAWTIDQAVTKTGNKTIIIEFNETHRIIKNYEDRKGNWNKTCGGNTNPTSALLEARKQMKKAIQRHKIKNWLVYLLTDGHFVRGDEADKIITELNKISETHLIYLSEFEKARGLTSEQINGHQCKNKNLIGTIKELEPLLQKSIQKTALQIRKKIER
jgi:hypothetical protein